MNTVLLIHNDSALAALDWAAHLAQRVHGKLQVLVLTADAVAGFREIDEASDNDPELVKLTLARIAEQELNSTTIYHLQAYRLKRAALDAVAELDAKLLILHGTLDGEERKERSLVRDLARAAPMDTLVLDVAASIERPSRVLFPQVRGGGAHGMQFALRAFCDEDHPLVVIPDPDAESRSRRTVAKVLDRAGPKRAKAIQTMDVDESMDAVIRETATNADLVLVDTEEADRVPARLRYLQKLRRETPDAGFAIGVTRADDVAGLGMFERMAERFYRYLPKLDREARIRVTSDLERGGSVSMDFVIMLMLSAGIAALGLVQNSTAVVIGGMLVAPLMTPILAASLALVQGNSQQFRESVRAMGIGIAGVLLVAMLIGVLSPWSDLSAEIVARGAPNLFDLGIAALSGVAAAYSLARPGLAGTLVGVAVAVALVPPLCAAGIALVKSDVDVAVGAAALFVTNLLAITLGAALVFRFFGLDISLRGNQAPRWVRVVLVSLGLALLPVSGLLFSNLSTQIHEGVQRNYSRPLPPHLRNAINARVADSPGTQILVMEQSGIEKGFGIHVALVVSGQADTVLEQDLRQLIHRTVGQDVSVSVMLLRSARDR